MGTEHLLKPWKLCRHHRLHLVPHWFSLGTCLHFITTTEYPTSQWEDIFERIGEQYSVETVNHLVLGVYSLGIQQTSSITMDSSMFNICLSTPRSLLWCSGPLEHSLEVMILLFFYFGFCFLICKIISIYFKCPATTSVKPRFKQNITFTVML